MTFAPLEGWRTVKSLPPRRRGSPTITPPSTTPKCSRNCPTCIFPTPNKSYGVHDGAAAAARAHRSPCSRRRTAAWRRHDGSHSRQGPNGNRPNLGLCSRRSALWRTRPAGGAVLRLAQSRRRASRTPSRQLERHTASRCVQRVQSPLSTRSQGGAHHRSTLLVARQRQILRARRHRRQCKARQERAAHLADRTGSGQTH